MAFECVYFSESLSPQWVCWAPLQMLCQLFFFGGGFFFFVRVPAIQDNNISVARSVELYCWDGVLYSTALIWGYNFQLFFFFFSQPGFVYIVYMKSFILNWDSLEHLLPQVTVDMKVNVFIKDRKLIIFAHKMMHFTDKRFCGYYVFINDFLWLFIH